MLLATIFCFGLTSCGTTVVAEPEETPSVKTSASPLDRPKFSFAEFEICYPITQMDELDSTLLKVEDGLLSKQDLAEGLSSLSFASEFASLMLNGSDFYEKNPETEQILPKADLPAFSERTKEEGIWYARARVKLIDKKVLNINELKNRLDEYRKYLMKYCLDYNN